MSEEFEVGETVFIESNNRLTKTTVEKITPKGFIKVSGEANLFNKNWRLRGSDKWSTTQLRKSTPAIELEFKTRICEYYMRKVNLNLMSEWDIDLLIKTILPVLKIQRTGEKIKIIEQQEE